MSSLIASGSGHSSRSSSTESLNSGSQQSSNDDVPVEVKFAINLVINKFVLASDAKEYEFPSSLSAIERSYVHKLCKLNQISSVTKGKGSKKTIVISKKDNVPVPTNETHLELTSAEAKAAIEHLLSLRPLSQSDREELLPKIQKPNSNPLLDMYRKKFHFSTAVASAVVPSQRGGKHEPHLLKAPVCMSKDDIVNNLNGTRFLIVNGEAGVGKTSQIGQFILDSCHFSNQKCKIMFAEPNRLLAYSVAKRVAKERGEAALGQIIGYQIEFDNMLSNAPLTFCTYEILLKVLANSNDAILMNSLTHIVLDEIDSRDKYSDLLLVVIKEVYAKYRHLKFVLIGTSLSADFIQKFNGGAQCPIVVVPSFPSTIQEYYLEDILRSTEYFREYNVSDSTAKPSQVNLNLLEQWCIERRKQAFSNVNDVANNRSSSSDLPPSIPLNIDDLSYYQNLADDLLMKAWAEEKRCYLESLIRLIDVQKIDVDYQHSKTGVTTLMAASISGFVDLAEMLIGVYGANVHLKSSNDSNALDWSKRFSKNEMAEFLECYFNSTVNGNIVENEFNAVREHNTNNNTNNGNENLKNLDDLNTLRTYFRHWSSRATSPINYELISLLLTKIFNIAKKGSIVVFFPSFREIVEYQEHLSKQEYFKVPCIAVHNEMNFDELDALYEDGCKIILATSVLEYMAKVNDVSYVIDCGLNQEVILDSATNLVRRKNCWISKYCAHLRKNKIISSANGFCYRLYSKYRFKNLPAQKQSQLLSYPLHEICLLVKLVSPTNISITDYISKAPDSPPFHLLRNSIFHLKNIDCLDIWEDMTELGLHLINFPVELKYAKMIMYALALRCLEPILVIVGAISCGHDIFQCPQNSSERVKLQRIKLNFAEGTLSDHIMLLKVYQNWTKAVHEKTSELFCETNMIKSDSMQKINLIKHQLTCYLRTFGFIKSGGSCDFESLNSNSASLSCIRAALTAGLFPHLIRIDKQNNRLLTEKETKLRLSCDSVLWSTLCLEKRSSLSFESLPSDWLVYDDVSHGSSHLHCVKRCTLISSLVIALLTSPIKLSEKLLKEIATPSDSGSEKSWKLDNWPTFLVSSPDCQLLVELRQAWNLRFLRHVIKMQSQSQDEVLDVLVNVLEHEDKQSQQGKDVVLVNGHQRQILVSINPDVNMLQAYKPPSWNSLNKCYILHYFKSELDHENMKVCLILNNQRSLKHLIEKELVQIYLIFMNPETAVWLGYARVLVNQTSKDDKYLFEYDETKRRYFIEWIKVNSMPFSETDDLRTYNSTKLNSVEDSYEITFQLAQSLFDKWM